MAKAKTSVRANPVFSLNGEIVAVSPSDSQLMVADFLRVRVGLTGTKIVCAEGDCGACTVLIYDPQNHKHFTPINSCIYRVAQLDGTCLATVEALAQDEQLSPLQEKLQQAHASQCGYCTPGFVMATAGLIEELKEKKVAKSISRQCAKNALTGNLCRCTGYEPIIEGATSIDPPRCDSLKSRYATAAQLRELKRLTQKPLLVDSPGFQYFAPVTLKSALEAKKRNAKIQILSAGTDLGVAWNKGKSTQTSWLSLRKIKELDILKASKSQLIVGANVPLTSVREFLKSRIPEIAKFLDRFASPQIKNVATLIGNVANASPIAECPPFLLALNAQISVQSTRGKRTVPIEEFFLGYRKTALRPDELITQIEFEVPKSDEVFSLSKVSQRLDLDISTVNTAFRVQLDKKTKTIKMARIAMGGVAAVPMRLKKIEEFLVGKRWGDSLDGKIHSLIQSEIQPISDLRASSAFRQVASQNLLQEFLGQGTPT